MARRKKTKSSSTKPFELLPASASRWHTGLALVLIVLAIFAVYKPCLRGGQLVDDPINIGDPGLRSGHGLYRIWFEIGATQQYYPIVHTGFWLENRLWGDATFGYHVVNVLLHTLSALLLFAVLSRLRIPGAPFATAVFALHPVMVESVAWISEQKNTLSTVFYFGSMLAYLRFDELRRFVPYVFALALFALALLSKTITVTLPVALLIILWWKRGTLSWKHDISPLVPFFLLGVIAGLLTIYIERDYFENDAAEFVLTPVERFLVSGRVIWFYLSKLIYPAELVFVYPRWTIDSRQWWQWIYPLAAIAMTAALCLMSKRWRSPFAAWLLFCGTLFPVLGFLNVHYFIFSFVADHLQYLASVAAIVFATGAAVSAAARLSETPRRICFAICIVWIGVLCGLTWRQSRLYADPETVYRAVIERNPEGWMAHENLGILLMNQGRAQDAIQEFETTLLLRPDDALAKANFAAVLGSVGRYDDAMKALESARNIAPNNPFVLTQIGSALIQLGQSAQAVPVLEKVVQTRPDIAMAWVSLGSAFANLGQREKAAEQFYVALKLQPANPLVYLKLGSVLAAQGKLPEAAERIKRALQLDPQLADAHNDLGVVLLQTGETSQAIEQFLLARTLNPNDIKPLLNLAAAEAKRGDISQTIDLYEQANRLAPNNAVVHAQLAGALRHVGRLQDAVTHYQTALQLKPNFFEVYVQLSESLAASNRSSEAITAASEGAKAARNAGQLDAAAQIEQWLVNYQDVLNSAFRPSP